MLKRKGPVLIGATVQRGTKDIYLEKKIVCLPHTSSQDPRTTKKKPVSPSFPLNLQKYTYISLITFL